MPNTMFMSWFIKLVRSYYKLGLQLVFPALQEKVG